MKCPIALDYIVNAAMLASADGAMWKEPSHVSSPCVLLRAQIWMRMTRFQFH